MTGMRPRDLFARHDFVIETSWPVAVAATEIRKRIGVPGSGGNEPLAGTTMSATEFQLSRDYRTTEYTVPLAYVTVEPSHRDGARVVVRICNEGTLGLIFMSIFAAILSVMTALASRKEWLATALVAVALSVVTALHHVALRREVRRTKAVLQSIFARAPGWPAPHDTGEPYR